MNIFLEKLTETCWLNEPTLLAIVKPMDMQEYVVINREGKNIFGPNNFDECATYIRNEAKEQGIFYRN